jgi:hypothetical protein
MSITIYRAAIKNTSKDGGIKLDPMDIVLLAFFFNGPSVRGFLKMVRAVAVSRQRSLVRS